MTTNKQILITGGAGFIGSQVNKMLHEAGYHIVVFDNLSTGNCENITHGTFVQGNTGDSQALDHLFQTHRIDAVMHFAASIDVGESVHNPALYYTNNVVNTLSLLNAMRRHGVDKLIFSSTAAIFGDPQENPITEMHPCNPINPYGQTKLTVEQILRDFDTAYGLKSCCLRYFNAAGGDPDGLIKNRKPHESNLIPIILRNIKVGNPRAAIFGTDYPTPDGTCIRDFIHIYDLGQAHIAALERLFQGCPSTQFNLGHGTGFSVREVIRTIEEVTHTKLHVTEQPRRAGDPPMLLADSKKAQQELGWKPQYPELATMVSHAWQALEIPQLL